MSITSNRRVFMIHAASAGAALALAGQVCTNCSLFQGKPSDKAGGCPLFAGKQVAGPGWCSAWVKKA